MINKILLKFDRSFSQSVGKQFLWLLLIMMVAFGILLLMSRFSVFYNPSLADEDTNGPLEDILFVLFDPGRGPSTMSATFAAIVTLVGIVIFSGMLVSVICNILDRRVERYREGEADYNLSDHIVIIGFNRFVPSLISNICSRRNNSSYILIQTSQPMDEVRKMISIDNTKDELKRVVLQAGQHNVIDDLKRLNPAKAKEFFIIGDDKGDAHDAINIECLQLISSLRPNTGQGHKISCHVQFESQSVYSVFQYTDFDEQVKQKMNVLPFNFHEIWAQKVLVSCQARTKSIEHPIQYIPIDGYEGIMPKSTKHVHLIISGMNDMGASLAIEAARIAHYPNFKESDGSTRTRITIIDKDIARLKDFFMSRFVHLFDLARWRFVSEENETKDSFGFSAKPFFVTAEDISWHDPIKDVESHSPYKHLGPQNFIDIEWEFIESDLAKPSMQQYLRDAVEDDNALLTIALCQEDSDVTTRQALNIQSEILSSPSLLQVLVRQQECPALINMLATADSQKESKYAKIRPFGMMTECYDDTLIDEEYGKLIHGSFSSKNGKLPSAQERDELWENASTAGKWSSIYCANMLYTKLRFIGCSKESSTEDIKKAVETYSDDIIRTEHNRWNTEKLLVGFRPLYETELAMLLQARNKEVFDQLKKDFKKNMAHLDICSNDQLKSFDAETIEYDKIVNLFLPEILSIVTD